MNLTPEHIEHLIRGLLWFSGTAIGAYLCLKEYIKLQAVGYVGDRQHPKLLLLLGILCVFGAVFNIFVILFAFSQIF